MADYSNKDKQIVKSWQVDIYRQSYSLINIAGNLLPHFLRRSAGTYRNSELHRLETVNSIGITTETFRLNTERKITQSSSQIRIYKFISRISNADRDRDRLQLS